MDADPMLTALATYLCAETDCEKPDVQDGLVSYVFHTGMVYDLEKNSVQATRRATRIYNANTIAGRSAVPPVFCADM